jgi:DNA helicase-2/ATP-dependent DNA helicase PcrA
MTTIPAAVSVTDESPFTEGLNERQREAVLHDAGPLVVLAGPGAGKTHMIVRRLARLVAPVEQGGLGAAPESVVALAYTVKAADELRERVEAMVGPETAQRMLIGTSHSFGRRIVRRFGDAIGLPWKHHIADSAERLVLLRELARDNGLLTSQAAGGMDNALHGAMEFISACHTDAIDPAEGQVWIEKRRAHVENEEAQLAPEDAAAERADIEITSERVRLYELFELARLERGMLSLDDYLLLPIRILRDCQRPRDILRAECRHIVVDEFQDWNPAQIGMLGYLCPASAGGPSGPDLCVVGDDDQSIYAFRGADDRAFERFAGAWPNHTKVALEINYRSEAPIIDAGNAIIERAQSRFAPEKRICVNEDRTADSTARVEGVLATTDADIGPIIAAMVRLDHEESNRPFSDYAVLARTHNEADKCAVALELEGVPVNRRRKQTPLDDQGVRDLMAWCGLLTDGSGMHDIQRVLVRPPIGADIRHVQQWTGAFRRARSEGDARSFLGWLRDEHADHDAVARLLSLQGKLEEAAHTRTADDAMHTIIREVDLVHAEALDPRRRAFRIENLIAVLRFVRNRVAYLEPPGDLAAFLRHYEDLDDRERAFEHAGDSRVDGGDEEMEEHAPGVAVLTAHSAKGLEFDTVFIPRVRPQHGFPKTSGGSEDRLLSDPELTGRHPTSHIDEERRLFYVAATRAKRRLALVAKKRKSKRSTSTDFFDELTLDALPEAIVVSDGDDWLRQSSRERPESAAMADEVGGDTDAWIDEQIALARQQASGAVFDAGQPGLDLEKFAAVQTSVASATSRLAALTFARIHGAAPEFIALDEAFAARLQRRLAKRADEPTIVRPMVAPLTLSYSKLVEYQGCPRCYYVKYVLRLDEPKTSALSTGSVVHEAIERFLNGVLQ